MRLLVTVAAVALASPNGCCGIREGFRPPEAKQAFVIINKVLTPPSEGADVYLAAIGSGKVAKVMRGLVSRH